MLLTKISPSLSLCSKSVLRSRITTVRAAGYSCRLLLLHKHAGNNRSLTTAPTRLFTAATKTWKDDTIASKEASRFTQPAWPHPVYTEQQMNDVVIAHRKTKDWSDWVALTAVRLLRWGFDFATGYRHDKQLALGHKDPTSAGAFHMTPTKWISRFIFLESIAGVPGMVGGMVRHLHSLRKLRRDNGWIETLLEEAYNERLHLLTFLSFRKPGIFMRAMILGAQGVFFNGFFISYLVSPKTCHRFVGYLEEEAVITYTRAIADIENGSLKEWEDLKAPDIAVQYFNMQKDAKMIDLLKHIRADEAKHREVNHTLANLEQNRDANPYVAKWEGDDESRPRPTKGLECSRPVGWERGEVAPPKV